ncbi:MAG: SDR family oxidoreductase [Candidatus Nitronauta litoralis]|uniref:SDR family oxidoreductase n=1 Tax=Candidatus Nitronauta litoralis TaxID=2705533 RepID=A0A7T0G0H2_9BACT|nr:MAG: SDR family oxidoreductase [Candidatus Nitronauta litoralis]
MPTALITGGAVRIGQALAQRLAHRGYNIALHHGKSDPADTLAYLDCTMVTTKAYPCDLSDLSAVESLVESVKKDFDDLEILVNCAANFIQENVETTSMETLDRTLNVNLKAPFILMREFKRLVGCGQIVNILDERIEKNIPTFAAYSVSKVGLAHLTKLAAVEWGETVRVNGIAPGLILPPQGQGPEYMEKNKGNVPMNRHGSVDDLAKALDYLLDSEFVNGEILFVDGGESRGKKYNG